MSTSAFILMFLAVTTVTALMVYFLVKLLKKSD
jgi:hypothetical protein